MPHPKPAYPLAALARLRHFVAHPAYPRRGGARLAAGAPAIAQPNAASRILTCARPKRAQ
ncbi:MAG: hypothetical protein FJ030_07390 [Chloroflexi bacterium]|nr:hypothetical protein [Chloroflexota bacterium]